ncbi:MAG TPA: histidine kinase dimerization/phospho-acceptor domain-containing protein, partial [Cytophagales bacterium]|nr:histidine kinase dimerization/phospho-acceptor domain-containing protein [Cytophagales bacterium]
MSDYKRQHDIQEELLNYKALYEEKAKELEQFAYIVSHDLQGPLKNLLVFAQLLKADNENKLDAESLTLIKYMNDSVGHVMEQVQVLLKYSRLGNRNVIEDVDLNAIVEKVKQHFATEIADLQAQINCPNLPIISGLSSELYILFECLIHNALKFSKPSQKVVIDIDFVARGDFWEFDIRDNGLGVDPS